MNDSTLALIQFLPSTDHLLKNCGESRKLENQIEQLCSGYVAHSRLQTSADVVYLQLSSSAKSRYAPTVPQMHYYHSQVSTNSIQKGGQKSHRYRFARLAALTSLGAVLHASVPPSSSVKFTTVLSLAGGALADGWELVAVPVLACRGGDSGVDVAASLSAVVGGRASAGGVAGGGDAGGSHEDGGNGELHCC